MDGYNSLFGPRKGCIMMQIAEMLFCLSAIDMMTKQCSVLSVIKADIRKVITQKRLPARFYKVN